MARVEKNHMEKDKHAALRLLDDLIEHKWLSDPISSLLQAINLWR